MRRLVADLPDGLLQLLHGLHHQPETVMEAAVTFFHPGRLELSDPRQDPIQLLLHLPLLLQLSQQGLSGADFSFVGPLEVGEGRLQPQHLLDGAGPQTNTLVPVSNNIHRHYEKQK